MTDLPAELSDAGWTLETDRKAIEKTFRFSGFRDALAWMVRAGFEAEAIDHHPEWSNVYKTVDVFLTTHESGGITQRDVALATAMDSLA